MSFYHYPMSKYSDEPPHSPNIIKCEGDFLIDGNNMKYLDLKSGLWNVSLGYNKSWVNEVKKELMDTFDSGLIFLDSHNYTTPIYNRYAEKLLRFLNEDLLNENDFCKIFYTNSGSEATELAIKLSLLSKAKASKNKIVAFSEGYHGTFFGGMKVSGVDQAIAKNYDLDSKDILFLNAPQDDDTQHHFLSELEKHKGTILALFIEPLVSFGGAIQLDKNYLNDIMRYAQENNILIIFDEVATGFYRLGKKFGFTDLKLTPDIILLSKSINNGFSPFGVVAVSKSISEKLKGQYIDHFSTQNGNLLGLISAEVTLNFYIENQKEILTKIRQIEALWKGYKNKIPLMGQGGIFAIPLSSKENTYQIMQCLKEKGILTYFYENQRKSSGLLLLPNYYVNLDHLKGALDEIVETSLAYRGEWF